ncbi:LysR family transcriptional regulator [Candidatus Bathyarchaeota archaeon]|nr:LysR family transcriptional regulator [Candidatus Bathyarchaeota archaeon]
MMLRIRDFKIFLTLVEEESFSKTGKKMDLTQSSISQAIQKIEGYVGTKLIGRSSKFFTLTPSGRIFHEAARDIIGRFEKCLDDIEQAVHEREAKIRIAVSTTPGEFLLPSFFSDFSKHHGNQIRVIVEMTDSLKAIELLQEGECEIAIVGSLMGMQDLDVEEVPLLTEDLVVVVSPSVKAENGILPVKDLARLTRVAREEGSGTDQEAQELIEAINEKISTLGNISRNDPVLLHSVQAVLSAISEGKELWSVVGYHAARKYAELGLVNIVSIDGIKKKQSRIIYLLHKKHELNKSNLFFVENIKRYYQIQRMFLE